MNPLAATILAPLLGAGLILLLRRGAAGVALGAAVAGLLASLWLMALAANGATPSLVLPGLPGLPLRLTAEPLNTLLAVLVAAVGTLVLVYAVGYMKNEAGQVRFFALMCLFLAAMQTLVLAGDWILLLAAWELIGLCSYLLIGFRFERKAAAGAAGRAFLYTRTADLGLYLAVFILIARSGDSAIAAALQTGEGASLAVGLLLLLAAMGKSAQTPLQDWLLRAMAGPTPVSALLHSATLVAAGAILLIRTAPLLPDSALLAVGIAGGVTTVVMGLVALAACDLKRLLAASTASQYGLMLIAVAAGAPLAALLHLLAHAAIKSSLFLGAGVFQHARGGTGFDRLGGVGRAHPRVFVSFGLAALALAGLPPLSGFFSKDAILGAVLAAEQAPWLAPLALAGTLLTGAYMARALRLLWRGAGEERPVAGTAWMGTGFAGLVAAATLLGPAFGPIEQWLGAKVSVGALAMGAGLVAALIGLALGAWVPARRLLGPLHGAAQQGFTLGGGLAVGVTRPVFALVRGCERLERALVTIVFVAGRAALRIARGCVPLEHALASAVFATGRVGLGVARATRCSDERGVDGLIYALVDRVHAWGTRARELQSGLVHRELAISVVGIAVILAVVVWSVMHL